METSNTITSQNFSGSETGFGMQPNGSFNMPKGKFKKAFLLLLRTLPKYPKNKKI
jgi:hypothetical protein